MALAITAGAMAVELRIIADPTQSIPAEYSAMLTRRMAHAESRIEEYAPGAPDRAKVEAAVRWIGYSMDTPTASAGTMFADAFRHSGAMAELSPWRSIVHIDLDDVDAAGPTVTPTPIDPSDPVTPPTPTPTGITIYVWVSPSATVSAVGNGAVTSTTDTITLPDFATEGHIIIAQEASEADLTMITEGGLDQFGAYAKGGNTFDHNGLTLEYWATVLAQAVFVGNGGTFMVMR